MILRTSQVNLPIESTMGWKVHQVNKIQFITPRLAQSEAEKIYGTKQIPLLSHRDPVFKDFRASNA